MGRQNVDLLAARHEASSHGAKSTLTFEYPANWLLNEPAKTLVPEQPTTMFGLFEPSFDPDSGIADLSGKVYLVTGGG